MNKSIISIVFAAGLSLVGCGTNDDGSSMSTYSSCKITKSEALLNRDRANDLQQCWNFPNDGFESKVAADAWCSEKVLDYKTKYEFNPHKIEYNSELTNCPNTERNDKSDSAQTVDYFIEVDVKNYKFDGQSWDAFSGKPDIVIYIDDKFKKRCSDTLNCKLEFSSDKIEWDVMIVDDDLSDDDLIGEGKCTANETCTLGQSSVVITSL